MVNIVSDAGARVDSAVGNAIFRATIEEISGNQVFIVRDGYCDRDEVAYPTMEGAIDLQGGDEVVTVKIGTRWVVLGRILREGQTARGVTVAHADLTGITPNDHHDRLHGLADALDHNATAWRLFYSNGSGAIIELGLGSAGQLLQSNGAAAAPTWVDAGGGMLKTSGGGYYLIPAGPATGKGVSSSASADTYGSWVEMRAASGNALFIVGVIIDPTPSGSNDPDYIQVDIGTGGAGAEISVGETKIEGAFPGSAATVPGRGLFYVPFWAPIPVAANTRIACRTADINAAAQSHDITLKVIDQADLADI